MTLGDEKYILLTTYRRDGTPVSTPVWVVGVDERSIGFWTSTQSGKAKRLAHTDKVTVQPCNARGAARPNTSAVAATARVVTGDEYRSVQAKVVAKYGVMTKFTKLLGSLGGILKRKRIPYGDCAVVITLP